MLVVVVLFIVLSRVEDGDSVLLHRLVVPPAVRNGTTSPLTLDCQYSLNHSERDSLVLKWYRDGKTIYQWIPPANPQGLGALRGKIDLDFESSPAPFARHRALRLVSPVTVDMTGQYTCKVSTLQNEVQATSRMVVYEPPHVISLLSRQRLDRVNLTCIVDHVFPEPKVSLYVRQGHKRTPLTGVVERSYRYSNWAWGKQSFAVVAHSGLPTRSGEVTFDCEVTVPEVRLVRRKSTVYSPGPPTVMASSSANIPRRYHRHHPFSTQILVAWCTIICLRRHHWS